MGGVGTEPNGRGFGFLFRSDVGRIGRATWWRGTIGLGLLLAVLTGVWEMLSPYTDREVVQGDKLFQPMTFVAYAYLLAYAFAVILILVCHYNLSAKRWRDRGRMSGLAGLLPLSALFAGAAHWLQPRVADTMPVFAVTIFDALFLGVLIWNVVELGTLDAPAAETRS